MFSLTYDNFDDYGLKTTFILRYHNRSRHSVKMGTVKILNRVHEFGDQTKLPTEFYRLPQDYCSLGFDLDYYKHLRSCSTSYSFNALEVLDALNDVACNPGVRENFEYVDGFQRSLLRESESRAAMFYGEGIILGHALDAEIHFSFSTTLKLADRAHYAEFNFNRSNNLRKRMTAIIGKNGTGKTQFLSNLANALSFARQNNQEAGAKRSSQKNTISIKDYQTGIFDTKLGPPFGKVIALSYNLFDAFLRPTPSKRFSYVYCGIRKEGGQVNMTYLRRRHMKSLKAIGKQQRVSHWKEIVSYFVDPESIGYEFANYGNTFLNLDKLAKNRKASLSAGESILIYSLTELLANISVNSLILFDEPETHLHPNAIANLMNVLYDICVRYDSFLVLATHSPIVIQEIPSSNVLVFEREGFDTTVRKLEIESYGENLTFLTRHVFETGEVVDGYRRHLKDLSQSNTYDEILKMFDNKLSLNAKMYLQTLFKK